MIIYYRETFRSIDKLNNVHKYLFVNMSVRSFAQILLAMVNFCAVYGCSSRGDRDNKSFFRLPAYITRQCERTRELSQKRQDKWLANISREIKPSNLPYIRVCSHPFLTGKPSALFDVTNPDWVPSLKLGYEKVSVTEAEHANDRHQRSVNREIKRQHITAAKALLELQFYEGEQGREDSILSEEDGEKACQTDLNSDTIAAMESEIQRLFSENKRLKEREI